MILQVLACSFNEYISRLLANCEFTYNIYIYI